MGDIFLTEKDHWSGARIKYTINLTSYLKPDNIIDKAETRFTKKSRSMSENQWNKIMDAKGQTGQKFFNYLVKNGVMIPDGTRSNGKTYDVYKVDIKRLSEEIRQSKISDEFFDAAKFIVNQSIPNRKVRRDY